MHFKEILFSIPEMKVVRSVKSLEICGAMLMQGGHDDLQQDSWNNHLAIGTLNYLVNCSHSELASVVHQCARFYNDLKIW